jgi:ABC-type antimicrobial peptide transport system permease subunit
MFGVSSFDPIALGGATLIVLGAAVAASLVPARRALRVDPTEALRYE